MPDDPPLDPPEDPPPEPKSLGIIELFGDVFDGLLGDGDSLSNARLPVPR